MEGESVDVESLPSIHTSGLYLGLLPSPIRDANFPFLLFLITAEKIKQGMPEKKNWTTIREPSEGQDSYAFYSLAHSRSHLNLYDDIKMEQSEVPGPVVGGGEIQVHFDENLYCIEGSTTFNRAGKVPRTIRRAFLQSSALQNIMHKNPGEHLRPHMQGNKDHPTEYCERPTFHTMGVGEYWEQYREVMLAKKSIR